MSQGFLLSLDQAARIANDQLKQQIYDARSLIKHINHNRPDLLICRPFEVLLIGGLARKNKLYSFEGCFRLGDVNTGPIVGGILRGGKTVGLESFAISRDIVGKTTGPIPMIGGTYAPAGVYEIIDYEDFADSAEEAVSMYEDRETNEYRLPRYLRAKPFFPVIDEIYVLSDEFNEYMGLLIRGHQTTETAKDKPATAGSLKDGSEIEPQRKQAEKTTKKKSTLERYEKMQLAVNALHKQNNRHSHQAICTKLAKEFGCAPDTIRKNTKLPRY